MAILRTVLLLAVATATAVVPPRLHAQVEEPEPVRMTLEEAIDTALDRSPTLRVSDAGRAQVEADRLGVVGRFLPRFDWAYGYSTSSTGRLDPTGQAITTTSHTTQLTTSYDLFSGFQRMNDYRAAGLRVKAEYASFVQDEWSTVSAVKEAWFAAVAAQELLRVEEDRVARQERQLDFVERQLALGRATRSDVLRSRVDLNNARLGRLTAANDVRAATFDLAEVVGVEQPVEPEPGATLEIAPLPITRGEALKVARAASPVLVASRLEEEAANASVSAARSDWWPSMSLNASTAWRNDEFPPEDRSWSVSLQANYPLFNGFQRESAIRRASASARTAQANRRATELALTANLDATYNRIEVARVAVDLAEETVELATEDLRVTEERYRVGLATILDLQASQITLLEAEVDLVERRFDYAIGLAQLEALLGREVQ